jgi:hypothetical protein
MPPATDPETAVQDATAQTDIAWVASIATAQARFTGDVTKVLVSSGRELLK